MTKDTLFNVAKGQGGVGLTGMYERVKKLGGTLQIDSGELGTTIKAELPIHKQRESTAASAS
jgi:signal transduction histidine kinase